MYQVTLETESIEEYQKFKDIAAMIVTAKAHGYAQIKIDIKEGELINGSIELKTKWA